MHAPRPARYHPRMPGNTSPARRLEQLRAVKVRPDHDGSIAAELARVREALARDERRLGGIGQVWDEHCPADHAPRTEVLGVLRGVLRIRVADDATRFCLERWLRGGGSQAIIRASRTPVRTIRLER